MLKKMVLAATAGLVFALTPCHAADKAQDKASDTAAKELVSYMLTNGVYDSMINLGAEVSASSGKSFIEQKLGRELTEDENKKLINMTRKVMREFLTRIEAEKNFLVIYSRHFTEGELKDILKYLNTPTGKKTLQIQGTIDRELMMGTQEFFITKGRDISRRFNEEFQKEFGDMVKKN